MHLAFAIPSIKLNILDDNIIYIRRDFKIGLFFNIISVFIKMTI